MTERPLKELKLEVTYRCPLVCAHCSSDAFPDAAQEMSLADAISVLDQAVALGLRELAISGGEPLLWPGLNDLVERAANHDVRVTVYTSGNVDGVLQSLDMLHNLGLQRVVFSIFGGVAEQHEKITRRRGSFDRTVNAIRDCVRLGLRAELHFVALAMNFRDLEAVAALARSIGASRVSVLRFVPQGRGVMLSDETLDRRANLELRRAVARLRSQGHDIRTGSPMNVFWLNEDPHCLSGIDRLIIGADLKLYPCDAFKQLSSLLVAGSNAYSDLSNDSLIDCWTKSPYLGVVRDAIAAAPVQPCCECESYVHCRSGCLAQKMLADGELHGGADPACLLIGA